VTTRLDRQKFTDKASRTAVTAAAFGLSAGELAQLRRKVGTAETGLTGAGKIQKDGLVARRLSITPPELVILRRSLFDDAVAAGAAARVIVRHVLELGEAPIEQRGPIRKPTVNPALFPPGTRRRSASSSFSSWNAGTNVFLTEWGDAVHYYADCQGMRGFRHAGEPDPVVHQVALRDPICRDRRACRKCFDFWGPSTIDRLDDLLESFHGRRRNTTAETRMGTPALTRRPPASPVPKDGRSNKKALKRRRDELAASKLRISVDELRARRRNEHDAARSKRH
jgi:hypothetical protein